MLNLGLFASRQYWQFTQGLDFEKAKAPQAFERVLTVVLTWGVLLIMKYPFSWYDS